MALRFSGLRREPYKDFTPIKRSKSIIRGYDLIAESVSFLNKFYKGVVIPKAEFDFDRYVAVSEDSFAYLFKALLKEIHGRDILKLSAHQYSDKLTLELRFSKECTSAERYDEILTLANEAGFSAKGTDYGIYLEVGAFITSSAKVYSVMPMAVYMAFHKAFFSES